MSLDILKVCSALDSVGEYSLSDRLAQVNQDYSSPALGNPGNAVGQFLNGLGDSFYNHTVNKTPMEWIESCYSLAHQMRNWLYNLTIVGDSGSRLKNYLVSSVDSIMGFLKQQERTSQFKPRPFRSPSFENVNVNHNPNPFMLNKNTTIPGKPLNVPYEGNFTPPTRRVKSIENLTNKRVKKVVKLENGTSDIHLDSGEVVNSSIVPKNWLLGLTIGGVLGAGALGVGYNINNQATPSANPTVNNLGQIGKDVAKTNVIENTDNSASLSQIKDQIRNFAANIDSRLESSPSLKSPISSIISNMNLAINNFSKKPIDNGQVTEQNKDLFRQRVLNWQYKNRATRQQVIRHLRQNKIPQQYISYAVQGMK